MSSNSKCYNDKRFASQLATLLCTPVVPNRHESTILKASLTSIDEALIGIFAGINVILDCEIITERLPVRSI